MSGTTVLTYLPPQKISSKDKTYEWGKQFIDAASNMIFTKQDWVRQSMYNKKVNYNLANNILDEEEIHKVFNPLGIQYGEFPASIQNYNKALSKVKILVGEEWRRQFEWKLIVLNEDCVSIVEKQKKDELLQLANQELQNPNFDPQKTEKKIKELDQYYNYEYQDIRAKTGSDILNYLWYEQNLQLKFNQGFEDALISAEELYRTDIVSGNPILTKCNPMNLYTLRNGNSQRLEDAEIIIEYSYLPIGKVIEEFYDELTPENIDYLEKGGYNNNLSGSVLGYSASTPVWRIPDEALGRVNNYGLLEVNSNASRWFGGWFNEQGEVRIIRCRWLTRLKRQIRTYFDEFGMQQDDIVSEYYKPNKVLGEKCRTIWINEWWEGIRIADDIYVKIGARETQIRNMSNPAKCQSGYVGTYYNINDSKSMSLMDRMRPFQYLYNLFWRKLELALARYNGADFVLPFHLKPNKWSNDQWMYYKQALGIIAIDPFNVVNEGVATGKLAGTMNTFLPHYVDSGAMSGYIQQMVNLIDYADRQIGEIVGVTKEREGDVYKTETVGGIERSVTQSNYITEPWFILHEDTKRRALMTLLETAKVAYKNRKDIKLQYVFDDLSIKYLQFDGDDFSESEYGLYIVNSAKINELQQIYKQHTQAALQNGLIKFSQLADIFTSNSMTSIRRKLERFENEKDQQVQQQQENELKAKQEEQQLLLQWQEKVHEDTINLEGEKLQNQMDIALLNVETKDKDLLNSKQSDDLWARIEEQQNRLNTQLQERKINVDKDIAMEQINSNERVNKVKVNKVNNKTKK